jgi:hypothetical protein
MPGKLYCDKCGHHFCDACVATRQGTKFCRHCGVECREVEIQYESATEQGFLQRLKGAFGYPLRGGGFFVVIAGIIIVAMLKLSHVMIKVGTLRMIGFGIVLLICAGGYLFTYLQSIVHSTVAEERDPPDLPGLGNFLEDIFLPFFRMLALTLFCFAPALIIGLWMLIGKEPSLTPFFMAAWILGLLYYPMAFLAVAVLDSAPAANPLVVIPAILKVPIEYLFAVTIVSAAGAIQTVGGWALARFFPESWTTPSMGELFAMIGSMLFLSFSSLYLLVVAVHLLGLIYVTRKQKLAWLER